VFGVISALTILEIVICLLLALVNPTRKRK